MHNLMAKEQLVEWSSQSQKDEELIDDYFNCLIECSIEPHQTECTGIAHGIRSFQMESLGGCNAGSPVLLHRQERQP